MNSNIARVSYENYLGVVGAHKVVDNFGAITKTLVGSGAPTPDSGPSGIYGSCLAVDDLQSTLGQFLGLDVIRSMRVHVSPGSRIVRFKTVNNFTGGIPIGKLKLNLKYRDATGKQVSTEFTNAETLTAATDWSQTITGTVVTTGEWVTITLSLWHYEALKSLFVWPEVYML
ncbi:MAG: hypothetical protein JZU65_17735 [Chlorobium sp.]|nr:hypothetical protein [Chlorobium sp.]